MKRPLLENEPLKSVDFFSHVAASAGLESALCFVSIEVYEYSVRFFFTEEMQKFSRATRWTAIKQAINYQLAVLSMTPGIAKVQSYQSQIVNPNNYFCALDLPARGNLPAGKVNCCLFFDEGLESLVISTNPRVLMEYPGRQSSVLRGALDCVELIERTTDYQRLVGVEV